MEVGVVYAMYPMQCLHCNFLWVASVEADYIKWFDGSTEINHEDDILCPNCNLLTSIEDGEPGYEEDE